MLEWNCYKYLCKEINEKEHKEEKKCVFLIFLFGIFYDTIQNRKDEVL